MLKEILECIKTLKLPSLLLIVVFFWFGGDMLKSTLIANSQAGIGGFGLLVAGAVLGIIIFVDYRYKEHSEHIMDQTDRAVDTLSRSLKITSETHSKLERFNQSTIIDDGDKIGKEGVKQYTVQNKQETPTN